ncbi:hypothetical protein DN390_16990 [Bacillus sp. SH7-1]|nr:hypothetical protein DN390_16990 [Bacillus sp. SH7-1]
MFQNQLQHNLTVRIYSPLQPLLISKRLYFFYHNMLLSLREKEKVGMIRFHPYLFTIILI